MSTFLITIGVLALCFLGFGIGVFFFGKTAYRTECGRPEDVEHTGNCSSKEAGICPIEDTTGALKMANKSRITNKD